MKKTALFLFAALSLIALSGCYLPTLDMKHQTAQRLALPSFMNERRIVAEPYVLTAFERVTQRGGGEATVYIEGVQLIWDKYLEGREMPTPENPVALHLATRDKSANVIWLARPCQYTTTSNGKPCDRARWTTGRFSLENLRAMSAALDDLKKRYGFEKFHLVGYGDGAGVAVHLAAARKDVKSLRTVAGILDTDVFASSRWLEQYETFVGPESHNPAIHAKHLAAMPQHHFIGEWDKTVTPDMAQAFRAAAGNSGCIRVSIVKGVTGNLGWVSRWPDLLSMPVGCAEAP